MYILMEDSEERQKLYLHLENCLFPNSMTVTPSVFFIEFLNAIHFP